jgi:PA domain
MLLSRAVRASWSIAAVLLVATLGRIARADNTAANEGAFQHLQALQDIASASGGNRAAGTSGYDRSAEYVAERLKEDGYIVRLEEFEFPFFEERAPPVLVTSTPGRAQMPASAGAVRTLVNSGSGDVTGPLRSVNLRLDAESPMASASGCETVDFQDFEPGSVALIRRGTCPFQTKVENAVAAGAIGVVIMNEGTDRRTDAFSGTLRQPAAIPVVGISYEHGHSLDIAGRTDGATVRLAVNAATEKRRSRNVLADAPAVAMVP